MTEARYWIGLSLVPDVGPVISKKLLAAFGSPEYIFEAGLKDLLSVKGLSPDRAESIKSFNRWDVVDRQLKESSKKNIRIIHCNDAAYPAVL